MKNCFVLCQLLSCYPKKEGVKGEPVGSSNVTVSDYPYCHMHMVTQDFSLIRSNRLVGVTVLPLREIMNTNSYSNWLPLDRALYITEKVTLIQSSIITIVLLQRIICLLMLHQSFCTIACL